MVRKSLLLFVLFFVCSGLVLTSRMLFCASVLELRTPFRTTDTMISNAARKLRWTHCRGAGHIAAVDSMEQAEGNEQAATKAMGTKQ